MKKFALLLFLSAIISATAGTLSAALCNEHTARDGDRLHPGIASSSDLIRQVKDSDRFVLIRPDAVFFDGSLDAAAYIDGDTVSYVQAATKHRFLLRGDTLSYLGFENRSTDFRIDPAVKIAVFPLKDDVGLYGEWKGSVYRDGYMVLRHVRGTSVSAVSEGWTLTDGVDTVRGISRLVWTLDMSYADIDSVMPSMPDSVASEKISEMQVDVKAALTERMLTERSLSFTGTARYPVLTDTRISHIITSSDPALSDTVPMSNLAMYYPPSYQYSDTGEVVASGKPVSGSNGEDYLPGLYPDGDDGVAHTVSVSEADVNGSRITVTLSSGSGPVSATVTACNDSGILLSDPVSVTVGTVPHAYTVNIPGGSHGIILLIVETDTETFTRKVII